MIPIRIEKEFGIPGTNLVSLKFAFTLDVSIPLEAFFFFTVGAKLNLHVLGDGGLVNIDLSDDAFREAGSERITFTKPSFSGSYIEPPSVEINGFAAVRMQARSEPSRTMWRSAVMQSCVVDP